MSNTVSGVSDSTSSNLSDHYFSTRSSTDEDEEMLETPGNHMILPSPSLSNFTFDSSHNSLFPDDMSLFPFQSADHESIGPAPTSIESEDSSPPTVPDSEFTIREGLKAKGWIFPPDIPVNVIKYAIGRRELAMQTQMNQFFDLVNLGPYTNPPPHTPETEKLKAWHKMVTRTPKCLPSRRDEPESPQIKLAFGPLGWDQVWAYEYIDLKKVLHNAGYKYWWLRRFEDHRLWASLHNHIAVYGAEVKFPYGYDTKIPATDKTDTEKSTRIPANEGVLIPLGKDVADWARQVYFLYEHWEDGPRLPYPFNPYDRMQEPPTITLRFKNTHPEVPSVPSTTTAFTSENKGNWTKSFLTTDELTILTSERNTIYLDTVISGGPKPNPSQTNEVNRFRMLQLWCLERKREDMVEWLVGQQGLRERYRIHEGDLENEKVLRRYVRGKVYESVARVIRDTPF